MPGHPHTETHFTGSKFVRDMVIGMSDGLTVPFALAAGLSGATMLTRIIVTAGLAEIAAGAIAMGLGGYLASKSDAEHFASERRREESEILEIPEEEAREVTEIFTEYGITPLEAKPLVDALRRNPNAWVDFMMKFELGLEQPDPKRAYWSAGTIAGAYIFGGLIPLAPYMLLPDARSALAVSAGVTLAALAVFGFVKGRFTGVKPFKSALQTTLIGSAAAGAAYGIAALLT